MFELLVLIAFIGLIYYTSKKQPKNQVGSTEIVNVESKNYIQGYLDGFNDHKRNIENTHITKRFSNSISSSTQSNPQAVVSKPVMSVAEQAEHQHLQNINIALYMASFLLVIAAALFMQMPFSNETRFIGVWAVTILFYASGLYIYKKYPKLKPAAIAFVGTGLALIPFTGFALNYFILQSPELSWMITSLIGVIGYLYAAAYLRSQTISYFAIAFMVSLSTSSVASMNLALIWYFVVLIVLGSILTIIAKVKSSYLPSYFVEPLEKTNVLIVPLTLVASLLAGAELVALDYSIITAACAVYYLAVSITSPKDNKNYPMLVARLLASFSALSFCYYFTESFVTVGLLMSIIAIVQIAISVAYMPIRNKADVNNESWMWIGFAMQLLAMTFVQSDASWAQLVLVQSFALAFSGFSVAYYLKRSEVSLFGSVAMIISPLVWGLNIANPVIESKWLSLFFAAYIIITLAYRYTLTKINEHPVLSQTIAANFVIFTVMLLALPLTADSIWIFSTWLISAISIYIYVYLEKKAPILIPGNLILIISGLSLLNYINPDSDWVVSAASICFVGIFYTLSVLTSNQKITKYSDYFWVTAITSGVVFGLLGMGRSDTIVSSIACMGVVVSSVLMMIRGMTYKKHTLTSWGLILLTLGLQRLVGINVQDLDFLVYTHWWAFIFASLSYAYSMNGKKQTAKVFTVIGLLFITLFGGLSALSNMMFSSDNVYSMLFLVEHSILLVFGLVASSKLQRNWGVVSLIIAALFMMENFTFWVPVIIAAALIMFAVKSLSKQSTLDQK